MAPPSRTTWSLGPLAARDVVREITGSETVNVMGYCIGGTLLAMTLAWLAAKHDTRFGCASFIVSLQDFSQVGDTAVFLGEPAIDFIEQQMMQRGYLDSREMSNMFNLLRSNDLIWSNVVNNYLLGQQPPAFDLLYWNSDGTRMTRAAHSWYLHNTYVENNLIQPGKIQLKGEALDLGRITLDAYAVGAERDHIVPWRRGVAADAIDRRQGALRPGLQRPHRGIINPPGGKGSFWVNDGNAPAATPEQWRASTTRHDGSWWSGLGGLAGRARGSRRATTRARQCHVPGAGRRAGSLRARDLSARALIAAARRSGGVPLDRLLAAVGAVLDGREVGPAQANVAQVVVIERVQLAQLARPAAMRLPARGDAVEAGQQAGQRIEPGEARSGVDDSGHDGASWCSAAIAALRHKVAGRQYVKGPDRFVHHAVVIQGRRHRAVPS